MLVIVSWWKRRELCPAAAVSGHPLHGLLLDDLQSATAGAMRVAKRQWKKKVGCRPTGAPETLRGRSMTAGPHHDLSTLGWPAC